MGFPAPAGMDPATATGLSGAGGIPRTRGDGPFESHAGAYIELDSPHPRGWTPWGRAGLRQPCGFPAPAGMDPYHAAVAETHRRIPRTRGDGPRPATDSGGALRDSPHPRGWTVDSSRLASGLVGFPAPAGMDRRGI